MKKNIFKPKIKKTKKIENKEINKKFENYKAYYEKEDNETTWEYGIFSRLIDEYISEETKLNIVEVGIARAGNVKDTIEKLGTRIQSYIGIDPYLSGYDDSDIFSQKSQVDMDYCYSYVLNKINDERFKLYRSSSEVIAPLIPNKSIDAIYIDGDHSYEGVLRDIILWKNKVKQGGIIVGDDYPLFPGVKKAVNESFDNFQLEDNCWFHLNS